MQAKVPSKSARTREATRKQCERLSNYLENIDCSSKDEKVLDLRPNFTRSQFLQKEENFHSSAGVSSDNATAQRYNIDMKDTIQTIINSINDRIALEKKRKLSIKLKVKTSQLAHIHKKASIRRALLPSLNQNINQV